jgi:hypothetical protein
MGVEQFENRHGQSNSYGRGKHLPPRRHSRPGHGRVVLQAEEHERTQADPKGDGVADASIS